MIDRSGKNFTRRVYVALGLIAMLGSPAWAQAPTISWSLDSAIKQIERQAKDFETAMARVEVVREADDGSETSKTTGTGFIHKDGDMRYNIDGGQLDTVFLSTNVTS